MQDEAVRWLGALSFCLVCGAFAACAGSETPRTDDDFEAAIADTYGNGSVGVAGSGNGSSGSGGSGSGGSGAGRGGSGAGRGGSANAGSAGSAGTPSGGGSGGGQSSGECNGFAILQRSCDGANCHGAGSLNANFAESEEIAAAFAGEDPVTPACSMDGPLINTDNPRGSLLIQKVNGTVPCGSAMPLVGTLDDDQIDCLEEWIGDL